ncbi:MAG: c-type cytochrome [Gammaproteobacteria bacterium]|nr:c-type cytochrome [Gammaproteobacteria bacterium]
MKFLRLCFTGLILLGIQACQSDPAPTEQLSAEAELGKAMFFDTSLSSPAGQSCASCHSPQHGFADPDQLFPVSQGVHPERFGNRNTPSAAYAAYSPAFHYDEEEGLYVGGQFWDGRAATLEAQAKQPFLNPVEMNNANPEEVVNKVRRADYAEQFESLYGKGALDEVSQAYEYIARAIAAYERSHELNPFTSKFDYYLRGKAQLSEQEMRGLKLFEAENKGNCAACHPTSMGEDGSLPLLTDFTYDNLGSPANLESPFYVMDKRFNPDGSAFRDFGLGVTTGKTEENGKVKVPTLRNIELTAPYNHNGVFTTLRQVVDFYNTRDVDEKWGEPEIEANVNRDELGDLKLTEQEVEDIVAFMKTLTDGYESKDKN